MGRLFIILALFGWYITVRSIIYYYFIGGPNESYKGMEFFDWWWSWGIAIPATGLTCLFGGIFFFLVVPWVKAGF